MSFPSSPPALPAIVARFAVGRPVRAVWVNELGGVTFRVDSGMGAGCEFIKVARRGTADFANEARRLRWAAPYLAVPRVLGVGVDGDWAWLHTDALPGLSAVHPRWRASPQVAVPALGAGLRTLHDSLPVHSCPFDWSTASRLAKLAPARRAELGDSPPVDRLVVCHGDACSPNTILDDTGRCCGHVDFGNLGVADRWADLAVATLSLQWNFPDYPGQVRDDEFSPPTVWRRTRLASTTTAGCGRPKTTAHAKLEAALCARKLFRKVAVQVTSVGHAGFLIQTQAGSILCDPWVNPAYFASWFPFPDNSGLDWGALGECDYLYVSHLHKDHFDAENLRAHVNKDAVVLLPDFPVPDLRNELQKLGFHRFFETTDSVKHRLRGPNGDLDVMIIALRAPADGPIGDSALVVADGETTAFNMNDARPVDLDVLASEFGHIDVHMLQYSGAIWYPMVYDMPARAKDAFGAQKRQRQMDRARQYIAQVGATWVVPSAGPPCFLAPELRHLNDDGSDPANIFPDQMVFLDQMRAHGQDGGLLMIPGSTADFTGTTLNSLRHPLPAEQVEAIFTTDKAAYIADYADRMAPVLAAQKAGWAAAAGEPLLQPLRTLFEPIMLQSNEICDGIGYPVELAIGPETIVLDFPKRAVREPIPDERFRYGFAIAPELVRTVLRDNEPDWVNTIFLSTRFRAWRVGGYNEYLYTFFKCLTDERIAYADGWFAEAHDDSSSITLNGWEIQRRCPHLKADLSKFGVVEGNTLTCNLHGWQWRLDDGRCLTARGHQLRSSRP